MRLKYKADIDVKKLTGRVRGIFDDILKYDIHELFVEMCEPYVPKQSGTLADTVVITKNYVRYTQPYAHYQYVGDVYGPNIPIIKQGVIVGWFSIPGMPKHPTGARIEYSKEQHPLATSEWDKAMMRDKGDEFKKKVELLVKQRAKVLYG